MVRTGLNTFPYADIIVNTYAYNYSTNAWKRTVIIAKSYNKCVISNKIVSTQSKLIKNMNLPSRLNACVVLGNIFCIISSVPEIWYGGKTNRNWLILSYLTMIYSINHVSYRKRIFSLCKFGVFFQACKGGYIYHFSTNYSIPRHIQLPDKIALCHTGLYKMYNFLFVLWENPNLHFCDIAPNYMPCLCTYMFHFCGNATGGLKIADSKINTYKNPWRIVSILSKMI